MALSKEKEKKHTKTLLRSFFISKFKDNTLSHCLSCFHLRTIENKYFSCWKSMGEKKKTELIFCLYCNAPILTKKYIKSKRNTKSRIRNHPFPFHYVTRYKLSSQMWEHCLMKASPGQKWLSLKIKCCPRRKIRFCWAQTFSFRDLPIKLLLCSANCHWTHISASRQSKTLQYNLQNQPRSLPGTGGQFDLWNSLVFSFSISKA